MYQNKNRLLVHIMRKRSNNPIMKKAFEHNDEYYYNIIRENISKYRELKKLTQQDLADMTELSREYICDIENKNRNKHPSITVVGRIAEALNLDICDLLKE